MPGRKGDDHNLYRVGRIWYLKIKIGDREIRESLRTENRAQARRRRDQRLEELKGRLHSWPEAVGRWLADYLPQNVDATTARRYTVSIGQIVDARVTWQGRELRLEEMPIERIRLRTIGEIVAWSKRHRPKVTHATLRRDLTALSSVLRASIGWGWRDDNPARNWDRSHIKERRDPILLPLDAHVDAVIAHSPERWGQAVRMLDLTGMRADECFGLQHDQIAANGAGVTLTKTKAGRMRRAAGSA